MKTYQKITFKPLARNRYRCNQTGVVVSASKTQSYRSSLLGMGRKKNQDLEKTNKQTKTYTYYATVLAYASIRCPVCNDRLWVGRSSGVVTCSNSHRIRVKVR